MTPEYRIEYDDHALADLLKLSQKARKQVIKAIEKLGKAPRSGNIKQLKGYEKLLRLRTGDIRVIYAVEDNLILVTIIAVGIRKDVYNILKRRIR